MSTASAFRRIDEAARAAHAPPGPGWWILVACCAALAAFGGWAASLLLRSGLHLTGLHRPVGWGSLIVNFVFWIGIAHAGTLVSAVLHLFRARFRTPVHRVAEMMTVFAVMTAGLFPILHLGRPWLAYWLVPWPGQRQLWPNFRSPLVWDVFAVSTYLVVSVVFLLVGVAPDAAGLAARATGWRRRVYAALSLGWRGTEAQWRHHARAYALFCAFVTPLVVSVHSVVSWDFAVSLLPGWHSTLFPPFFVAGAILSGLAMAIAILVPLRTALRIEDLVTPRHLARLAELLLVAAAVVAYCTAAELAAALSAPAESAERATALHRTVGPGAPLFAIVVASTVVAPAALLARRVRRSPRALLAVSLAVCLGMWIERLTIVVTPLSHDRLPFLWRDYAPTWVEWSITAGAVGWFLALLLVALRILPPLAISDLKEAAAHDAREAAPGRRPLAEGPP
jgi:molybdopterin-containing oxidoreductase family membrane subunit